MNVLILGYAKKHQYIDGILDYANSEPVELYTFENFFNEELDEAAEDLDVKLFVKNYYNQENLKIDKLIYFSDSMGLTEVLTATTCITNKKPVIFIPV